MKIYFPNITFQGYPFVWELNEKTHQATCLLYCVKKETHARFEPNISLDIFKKFPGVTLDNGAIIIKDIRTFNAAYQNLAHLNELKDKITQSETALLRQKSSFFQSRKEKSQDQAVSSSPIRRRSLSNSSHPLYVRIILNELIKNDDTDSSLWGDTASYETYFAEKTNNDAQARGALFLKSAMSLSIMVQYEKNHRLYPLKSKLIKEIRGLLEELDPIYTAWCTQENIHANRKLVFHYFQNAVLEAMLNGNLNNKATEFEAEPQKLNPTLRKYAIDKARALRAELMLIKFNVLLDPELHPELALSEKEAKKLLPEITSLRDLLLKQPGEILEGIQTRLKKIAKLIIKSGVVEESNALLSTQLNHALSINSPVVMAFHSFQTLLHTLLDNQITASKKELIPDIVTKVTKETINQISKTFGMTHGQYIAPLSNIADSNFYLCKNWADKLAAELAEIKLKHPKDEKKITVYSQAIADKVVDFLHDQLHEFELAQDNVATATSMSIM